MFSTERKIWKTLAVVTLAVFPYLAQGEGGYPDRPNRPAILDDDTFNREIGNNRKNNPIRAGETEIDFSVRTSHLPGSLAPTAPEDSAGPNGGTVDRAEKLSDAERLAQSGRNAAGIQATDMIIALSNGLTSVAAPGENGSQAGSISAIADAASKYSQIWSDMTTARDHNRSGKVRLRYDPDDDKEAGPADPALAAGLTEKLLEKMSPEAKDVLQSRGLNPQEVLERLLSGEIDTQDPAAVLRELGDTTELSAAELAEAKEIAAAKSGAASGDLSSSRTDETNAGANELSSSEASGTFGQSGRTHPELAGYAISPVVGGRPLKVASGEKRTAEPSVLSGGRAKPKRPGPAVYYGLREKGITAPRYGGNIFAFAHRGFRNFGRGRESVNSKFGYN